MALTLPLMLAGVQRTTPATCNHPAGPEHVKRTARDIARFLACPSVGAARRRLEAVMNELGLERRLSVLGIRTRADRERIIGDVDPARAGNHPRRLSPAAVRRILIALG